MPCPPADQQTRERIRGARASGWSKAEAARRLRLDRGTVRKYWDSDPTPADPPKQVRDFREDGDSATVAICTSRPIKTLDDAVAAAEVDPAVWSVDRWECSQWTVPVKVGEPAELIQTQQYRVKVWLRRLAPRAIQAATDAIFTRMAALAPKYKPAPATKPPAGETFLALFGLFDVHFGKLAWGPETGENYDLRIAEAVYRNAVNDLIAESAHRAVGRIVLPIGNDFFHFDNSQNTTYAGTPQDVDGRYAKVIEAGEMAVIWAVERLMSIAPVTVVWVPGNHDPTTSYHLARTVAAWFHNARPTVEVDALPCPRKYVAWGVNLLGLTHGHEEKHDALPNLMAQERAADWAAARSREWLIGHQHQTKKFTTKPVGESGGTVIRVLRSLAGTDAWHHRKGYVHSTHAAEVYWYGRERGYAGHAIAPARV